MKKHHFLLAAISCFFFLQACQKESIAPLPESTAITTATTNDSPFFNINTVEDLAKVEQLLAKGEIAVSRNNANEKVVRVPSDSKNAIQAAIDNVAQYGTVYLEEGNHYEEQPIVITKPVFIVGRTGATIVSNNPFTGFGITDPVFSIRQTKRVTIWGIEMQGEVSSSAVEILNSTHTVLSKNTINGYLSPIGVYEGSNSLFWKNEIVGRGDYIAGIGIISGTDNRIIQNKISGFDWNILCAGQGGLIQGNELFGSSNIGLDLSYLPPITQTSTGDIVGSKIPATNWRVQNNYAHHNYAGYFVDSGANNNSLINNRGENNEEADLVLASEGPNALGIITPASFENFVDTGNNKDFTIMDCGNDNEIVGGKIIPCN